MEDQLNMADERVVALIGILFFELLVLAHFDGLLTLCSEEMSSIPDL